MRGAGDAVAGEVVRGDRGGQVEVGLLVERGRPGLQRARVLRGHVQGERVLVAPVRVVRAGRTDQHGHVRGRSQRPYELGWLVGKAGGDDGRTAQPGLPKQVGDAVFGAGETQGWDPCEVQGRGGAGQAVALAALAEVDGERGPGGEVGGQPVHEVAELAVREGLLSVVRPRRRGQRVDVPGEGRVGRVVAEQVGGEPVRDA